MDKLVKDIKIKGEIKKMDFEQCYCQFAPLRAKFNRDYSFLPMDTEDIQQLIDMNFWNAFKTYRDTKFEFTTVVYKNIIHSMAKINRGHKAKKRNSYEFIDSLNREISKFSDEPTEIIETISDKENIEETVVLKLIIEKVLKTMSKEAEIANRMLICNYTQKQIAKALNTHQVGISRHKIEFREKLRRELSA